jgi:hypothetical protein
MKTPVDVLEYQLLPFVQHRFGLDFPGSYEKLPLFV